MLLNSNHKNIIDKLRAVLEESMISYRTRLTTASDKLCLQKIDQTAEFITSRCSLCSLIFYLFLQRMERSKYGTGIFLY